MTPALEAAIRALERENAITAIVYGVLVGGWATLLFWLLS